MKLNFHDYRQHVQALVQAALQAADPAACVKRHLRRDGRILHIDDLSYRYDLQQGRVFLISSGKAAVPMALAAAEIIGDDLFSAAVITKKSARAWHEIDDSAFKIDPGALVLREGGHPVSDEDSVQATAAALEGLQQTTAADLVLCLISGGTSALLTQPLISLDDWQALTAALLASGCTINELNGVRRQLDSVKGGGLARLAAPAACVGLILSDVVGNPLHDIGSGPTVFTAETAADARLVLQRYGIQKQLETVVWQRIEQALQEQNGEPQGDQETRQESVHNLIVGDVRQAARAAWTRAAQLGFLAQILTARLQGEAREVGRVAAAIAKDLTPGHCLVMGGETTVTVRGEGRGGRNQELALSAAVALDGWPHVVVATLATDGEDGPTEAAGAMVTGETVTYARTHHLDPVSYLDNNDSYSFFQQLNREDTAAAGGLIQTGPTGTNVNDLLFILAYPEETSVG